MWIEVGSTNNAVCDSSVLLRLFETSRRYSENNKSRLWNRKENVNVAVLQSGSKLFI